MNEYNNQNYEPVTQEPAEDKEQETKINIGEVYFDAGLEGVMNKEEFTAEIQKISREINEYLGENENLAVYDFRVYSDRNEYVDYLKTNFSDNPEIDYVKNDMYCIYDEKNNKYFIGKFMTLEIDPDDAKVIRHLEENKMTFDEAKTQTRKKYKNNIYPTMAHEMTHTHSFFKGADYRAAGNKWAQEMVSVFIDQKMWEKYTSSYGKKTRTNARKQAQNKNLYNEIINDFEEGAFNIEDWERFFYQFLENKFGKEKLKEFWSILSEHKSKKAADFEQCFENIFEEKLKDTMKLFQREIMEESNL